MDLSYLYKSYHHWNNHFDRQLTNLTDNILYLDLQFGLGKNDLPNNNHYNPVFASDDDNNIPQSLTTQSCQP